MRSDGGEADGDGVTSRYVLEGELQVAAEGREVRATEGTWLQVPAGVPHTVGGSARYVEVRTPA